MSLKCQNNYIQCLFGLRRVWRCFLSIAFSSAKLLWIQTFTGIVTLFGNWAIFFSFSFWLLCLSSSDQYWDIFTSLKVGGIKHSTLVMIDGQTNVPQFIEHGTEWVENWSFRWHGSRSYQHWGRADVILWHIKPMILWSNLSLNIIWFHANILKHPLTFQWERVSMVINCFVFVSWSGCLCLIFRHRYRV